MTSSITKISRRALAAAGGSTLLFGGAMSARAQSKVARQHFELFDRPL